MTRLASRSAPPRLPVAGVPQRYVIGLGSNRRHGRHGRPPTVLAAALAALEETGVTVEAHTPPIATPPLGPGGRRYANAVAVVRTLLDPPALLRRLKAIERRFGRRPGQRWRARVLDLDILLWAGGRWRDRSLTIPHARLAERRFVLDPLVRVVPDWRVAGALAVRHLRHRLTRSVPRHRGGRTVGL